MPRQKKARKSVGKSIQKKPRKSLHNTSGLIDVLPAQMPNDSKSIEEVFDINNISAIESNKVLV